MESSILMLQWDGHPTGPAALVDDSGLFVASKRAVQGQDVVARTYDGKTVHLTTKGADKLSKLVLLQAQDWSDPDARPFTPPSGDERFGGALIAILPTGPIRAEFVSSRLYGVVKPAHRLVPLTEFRFEAPAEEVGTALVFCENHDLIGALYATLEQSDNSANPLVSGLRPFNSGSPFPPTRFPDSIGPSSLTVAYTAGPDVVRRVLLGFRSPGHLVEYPTIGVFCTDAIGGGAVIQKINAESPAAKAGMKQGDIILDVAGSTIGDQVDFAKVMLKQEIGRRVTLRVKRGSSQYLADLTVAKVE